MAQEACDTISPAWWDLASGSFPCHLVGSQTSSWITSDDGLLHPTLTPDVDQGILQDDDKKGGKRTCPSSWWSLPQGGVVVYIFNGLVCTTLPTHNQASGGISKRYPLCISPLSRELTMGEELCGGDPKYDSLLWRLQSLLVFPLHPQH